MAKIIYVDMDNVLVDFKSGIARISEQQRIEFEGHYDDVPGIFALMVPVEGAVESFNKLSEVYDTYVLSTAPWDNPSAWSDKRLWVEKYMSGNAYKRLILSHHKNLNIGDYLIDDRLHNGAGQFGGEHLHFGTGRFKDWDAVVSYLL